MSSYAKQVFLAAVAACALIAFVSPTRAQDKKKEAPALQGQDMKYFREMAQADMAEVQAGKMAQSKAQSNEVKQYGQHMVEDHGKKVAEARSMAKSKGVTMPSAPAKKHQDAAKKLEQASGAAFDKAFMQQMVRDHEEALKLAQSAAKNAKDKDLRAAADKSVPVIQKHLEMAKNLASTLK